MTWDDQWPSYSLQSWKWTILSLKIPPVSWIDSCFGLNLVHSLESTHPQPSLFESMIFRPFQNWGIWCFLASLEVWTSGCRFWIPSGNPTCQRPAHSEVMLQEPSRWDGFPNDSTWPHGKWLSFRVLLLGGKLCIWEPVGSSIINHINGSDCSNLVYSMTSTILNIIFCKSGSSKGALEEKSWTNCTDSLFMIMAAIGYVLLCNVST